MQLKYVEFVFENCDIIRIDGEYIGVFLVENIYTSMQKIGFNSICKMNIAKTVAIGILKDANKERYQFGQTQISDFKQMIFDRFREYDDITSIRFELTEDDDNNPKTSYVEYYDCYVDWAGDNEYTNQLQKTCIDGDGNLCILIDSGKEIEDVFSLNGYEMATKE